MRYEWTTFAAYKEIEGGTWVRKAANLTACAADGSCDGDGNLEILASHILNPKAS